jgi:hypothetical protein
MAMPRVRRVMLFLTGLAALWLATGADLPTIKLG